MFLPSLRASSSRLPLPRMISTTSRVMEKARLGPSTETPTPEALLSRIGRNADKKLTPFAESWDKLNEVWLKTQKLQDVGLAIKERRYILWAFSRYSQGSNPSSFIRPPKPSKKVRGWGPKIQNGVRVRA
ncbi:hypothetical protein IAR55_006948 [Kwoniella newhampshirensis]|uniref:Small ribosomal subunit protein mS41 n=1 Tax=Kwoniella newhampshirensis TaxID=1651941 RepID=A0AAW0YU07_9TREE